MKAESGSVGREKEQQSAAAAPTARAVSAVPAARPAAPRAQLAVLRQACGRDYQANCAGVRPGGGQLIACLAANQARLTPGCQRAQAGPVTRTRSRPLAADAISSRRLSRSSFEMLRRPIATGYQVALQAAGLTPVLIVIRSDAA